MLNESEAVKRIWHNGIIKTWQIETSTEKAHLIKARDNSEYLVWLPVTWFKNGKNKEMTIGFVEGGEYTIFRTVEARNGYLERIDEKKVGWREVFSIFAFPMPKNDKPDSEEE